MRSLSPVKSGKLYHTIRIPPVFGSCNSKMLLVKSWDNMTRFHQSHKKEFLLSHFFSSDCVFTKCYTRLLCNNSFDVNTIKFNRFHNRKTFLFHVSFKLVWLKREIKKYFFSLIVHENKYCLIIFEVRYTAIIFQKY